MDDGVSTRAVHSGRDSLFSGVWIDRRAVFIAMPRRC